LKDFENMNYILPIHCGSPDMANLNLGSIYLKIDKDIDLSLDLVANKKVLSLNYFLLKIKIKLQK
jgi:hypothetical protein